MDEVWTPLVTPEIAAGLSVAVDAGTRPDTCVGNCRLDVELDHSKVVAESNETNNAGFGSCPP